SKKYRIDKKILSSDSPFLISIGSQDRVKLVTHEHLVLLALCEQQGTLLDKETLIEKGWQGKFVTDSSLTQAIRNI
ncbi:winged helix-turn-helix domain-containing protein, partial [Vibrio parahaemolyticus]